MKPTIPYTKKLIGTVLLLICVGLLFSGCTKEIQTSMDYFTTVDGQDIVIHFPTGTKSEGTISSENGEYTFSYSFDGTLSIIYPNGYTYSRRNIHGGTAISWEYNVAPEDLGFVDGLGLAWAIESATRPESNNGKVVSPILSILIVAVGIWLTWKPKTAWWLARGWMYKNVEPSDLALGIYRVVGIIIVLGGIISFFA